MNLICKTIGHKFKPRFDEVMSPSHPPPLEVEWISSEDLLKVLKDKIYVHDICVRCGVRTKR